MAIQKSRSLSIPFRDRVLSEDGLLSFAWERFFQNIYNLFGAIGEETSFALKNNQTTALNVDGLQFDSDKTNQVTTARSDGIVNRRSGWLDAIGNTHLLS